MTTVLNNIFFIALNWLLTTSATTKTRLLSNFIGNCVWQDFVTVKKYRLVSIGNGQLSTRTRVILLWATPVGLRPNGLRRILISVWPLLLFFFIFTSNTRDADYCRWWSRRLSVSQSLGRDMRKNWTDRRHERRGDFWDPRIIALDGNPHLPCRGGNEGSMRPSPNYFDQFFGFWSPTRWHGICYGDVAVCVSVTLMYCVQTTESITGQPSPDCSPAILVFPTPNTNPIARGNPPH